ncbi:hypothetical protein M758_9G006900 [Ceratodon purpureus]|nr:hypothetical protein M758_9G006900 [Ceratodon purpureus]
MDFNSNEEYVKAFPPNFSPKIERPHKEQLFDLNAHGLPPKENQENVETKPAEVPEPLCLDDELECVEVQEPIQVGAVKADDHVGDVLLEEQEEILILGDDLAPEIDEPMPQMADMALLREEEMVVDDGDGGTLETMLSMEAIEGSALDNEPLGEVEAVMEDEIFEECNPKEFITSTGDFTELERPFTDVVDKVEGNAMETEAQQPAIEIQVIESTVITAETPDQIEFVESAIRALEEASENADAVGHIQIKEPVTLEVTEKTTIRTTPLTETKEKADLDAGTEETTTALEIVEKTTIKAKAICQDEEEDPRFTVKFTESTRTTITGFDEELDPCSEADVDRIVDSIMNDIAGIEANMKKEGEDAGLEANIESNRQHQKVTLTYEKPSGIEGEDLTCQDHVGPSKGHA